MSTDPNKGTLLERVASLAREIPRSVLDPLCSALHGLPAGAGPDALAPVTRAIKQPGVRNEVVSLLRDWPVVEPSLSGAALAWALQAAAHAEEWRRAHETVELVWTGPGLLETVFRRTDQALLDLIHEARRDILIVTFVAYKIPDIVAALKSAIHRGVVVSLVLESSDEDRDGLAALAAFRDLRPDTFHVYTWPEDRRPTDERGRRGCLHAKCAVADGSSALVSSANFTDHAMNRNMELGLLLRGGQVPGQIAAHFRALIANSVLQPLE